MITEYELYSDESERKLANCSYLMLGGIACTKRGTERLHQRLAEVRTRYALVAEMHWGKVSRAFLDAYKAWVDVFFRDDSAHFVMLNIDTSGPRWSRLTSSKTNRDERLASAYYQFLRIAFGGLHDTKRWQVYHDMGLFSRDSVLTRVEFLFNRTYKKAFGPKSSRVIRLSGTVDSKSEDIIQLADVLLGALGHWAIGADPLNPAKKELVRACKDRMANSPQTVKGQPRVTVIPWVHPDEFSHRKA